MYLFCISHESNCLRSVALHTKESWKCFSAIRRGRKDFVVLKIDGYKWHKGAGRVECDTEGKDGTISGNGGNTDGIRSYILCLMVAAVSWELRTKRQSVGRFDVSMLADGNSWCHMMWPDARVSEWLTFLYQWMLWYEVQCETAMFVHFVSVWNCVLYNYAKISSEEWATTMCRVYNDDGISFLLGVGTSWRGKWGG